MQESSEKIDQAVASHQSWLREKLTAKVGEGKDYSSVGDWLAANRDEVEQQLNLQHEETRGLNWQKLRTAVAQLLIGNSEFESKDEVSGGAAKPDIKWGVDWGEPYIAEAREPLGPTEKITLLRPLLRTHSSRGEACVPTSYAYMQILGEGITDFSTQKAKLDQILQRWKQEAKGEWVHANYFKDETQGKEVVPEYGGKMRIHTGLESLDILIGMWEIEEGNAVFSRNHRVDGVVLGPRSERSAVISTVAGLTGIVVSVEPENEFWRQKDVGRPPKVGELYQTAGFHALLAIDCVLSPDGDQKKAKFTLVDPQTGTVIRLTAQAIYEANRRHFERQFHSPREIEDNEYKFTFHFNCGTCWVG